VFGRDLRGGGLGFLFVLALLEPVAVVIHLHDVDI